ncbi:MAG: universal stress protein [Sphingomonas sp.]|jgi:nucleotide-binding universal stress UspA family protein|uniref:universal stress protein n=1 Tax=Sphingomonas sp. TaxID=28214 RepID=UPI00356786C5
MKNILVLVHDDAGQEARIQVALDMTRALEGHLTCLDVAIPAAVVGEMDGVPAVLALDERVVEAHNRARIEPRVRAEQVPYSWVDAQGYLGPTVRQAAGLADVIILNRDLDGRAFPDMYGVAGEVLIETGRPIVAVPRDAAGIDLGGHALVAWDGSAQADAALRASVPLLQLAEGVTLIEIDDGSLVLPVTDAATYLSRHGMHAIVRQERATFDLPSSIILDAIDEMKAAYLVMGGFGHSRFVEAALGGVSRRVLHECPVPVFLAR